MKAFILESEEEVIAVIQHSNGHEEFNRKIKSAIADHYVCEHDDVNIRSLGENYGDDASVMKIDIDSLEDGEETIRTYTLIETCIY